MIISPADWSQTTPEQLVRSHLQRPRNTARNYACSLETFRQFLADPGGEGRTLGDCGTAVLAVRYLCGLPRGAAKRVVDNFVQWLRTRYGALNTVRAKAESVMGLLRMAHRYEVIPWMLDPLRMPAPEAIRDTRGPSREQFRGMLGTCWDRKDAIGARDAAMLMLMGYGAYRCNEVLTLDVKHVDIPAREIEVLAKGLWGRIRYPIPIDAAEAIGRWLEFRGDSAGPLFTTASHRCDDKARLTYWGAYKIVRGLGQGIDAKCSPHKLRHFAVTELLNQTDGRIPWAMALTRHRDPQTLMIYNDERMTRAREAMELVSSGVAHYRLTGRSTDNL